MNNIYYKHISRGRTVRAAGRMLSVAWDNEQQYQYLPLASPGQWPLHGSRAWPQNRCLHTRECTSRHDAVFWVQLYSTWKLSPNFFYSRTFSIIVYFWESELSQLNGLSLVQWRKSVIIEVIIYHRSRILIQYNKMKIEFLFYVIVNGLYIARENITPAVSSTLNTLTKKITFLYSHTAVWLIANNRCYKSIIQGSPLHIFVCQLHI